MVARYIRIVEVRGSTPLSSTSKKVPESIDSGTFFISFERIFVIIVRRFAVNGIIAYLYRHIFRRTILKYVLFVKTNKFVLV